MRRAFASIVALASLISCRGVLQIEPIGFDDATTTAPAAGGGGAAAGGGGAGGVADPALPCPGIDLSSDGEHCGACDQSCLGGQCLEGRCLPKVIAGNEPHARGILAAGPPNPLVVWTRAEPGGAIRLGSKDADAPFTIVNAPAGGVPVAVALGTGSAASGWKPSLYYTTYAQAPAPTMGLQRVVLDITQGVQVADHDLLADGATYVGAWAVAADGAAAYFTARWDSSQVVRVDRVGEPVAPLYDSGQPEPTAEDPIAIAIDPDWAFWALAQAGEIRRVGKDGSSPKLIAANQLHPTAIAVAGKWVYWTAENEAGDTSFVRRLPRDGSGEIEQVCSTQPVAAAMGVDALNVYLIGPGDAPNSGSLRRARVDGSMPIAEVLVDGLDDPENIAVGIDAVYWTDGGAGTVSLLAKPVH